MKQTSDVSPSLSQYLTENHIKIGSAVEEIIMHKCADKNLFKILL